jgi:TonB family protein
MKVEERGFELNLLPLETERKSPARLIALGAASIGVHLVLGLIALSLPAIEYKPPPPIVIADLRKSVSITFPRFSEPTQKAPNVGKVSRELDVRSAVQSSKPAAPKFRPPAPIPGPPEPPPAPAIETPKIDVAAANAMPVVPNALPQAPPPEKPKNPFESVGAGAGPKPASTFNIQLPKPEVSAQAAARAAIRPPASGGLTVGDIGDDISIAGAAPSDGRPRSNLQLLSDPQGIDFKPYLVQVLAAVRHNWLSVIPESARLGRRGQVLIQFIIDRRGAVPKLVIASPSGTEAFDRAAVAGVSMSNPFPPLPTGYKGDQVRLQLAFTYNPGR